MASVFGGDFQLLELKKQQADLDNQIGLAVSVSLYDQLAVQRLKRQRTALIERIKSIQRSLTPDIIA